MKPLLFFSLFITLSFFTISAFASEDTIVTSDHIAELAQPSNEITEPNTPETTQTDDGLGNFIQFKKPANSNQQIVRNFFYDGLGRITAETNPYFDNFSTSLANANTTLFTNYSYDSLGRVIN